MWTGQFGMHNVSLTRSTLGQQLHSLLSLDILVMPNFNFCFKKKLPSALRGRLAGCPESNLLAVNIESSRCQQQYQLKSLILAQRERWRHG